MWWPSFLLGSCEFVFAGSTDVILRHLSELKSIFSHCCLFSGFNPFWQREDPLPVISAKMIFNVIFSISKLQDGTWFCRAIFECHCVFSDSTDGTLVNLKLKLKQRISKMLMLLFHSLWPIPSTLLPVPVSEQEGAGVLPVGTWEACQCLGITVYSIWANCSWLKH